MASLADAGMVTVGVTDLADARAASLADAGTAFPADPAGVVTVGVASLADTRMAFPADPAGVVTVGVAPLADAEMVTVGVSDLADAGMAFPADPAGVVMVCVASLADAGLITVGVTDLADAGAVSLASPVDIADGPECGGGVIIWGDRVSPEVWCRERTQIQSDLDCQCVSYASCDQVGIDYIGPLYTILADGCTGSFGTLLSGPLCPVTDDVTYWEKIEALVATLMTMMRGLTVSPDFGKAPKLLLVFPARWLHAMVSQLPRMGGYSQYEGGSNTPCRTLLLSYVICRTDPLLS